MVIADYFSVESWKISFKLIAFHFFCKMTHCYIAYIRHVDLSLVDTEKVTYR